MDTTTLQLETGSYQHYKGNFYEVIGVGRDTESEEPVVIYRPLYESDVAYWVRPFAMFVEPVLVNDQLEPRFKKVNDHQQGPNSPKQIG